MATQPGSALQHQRNPLPFGLCSGLVVAATAMLALHGASSS
jgi:hypothetical protein